MNHWLSNSDYEMAEHLLIESISPKPSKKGYLEAEFYIPNILPESVLWNYEGNK
ncbi:MAG: hypothetical protein N3I35_15165 [Clostridia bacterium]|nr:hypothetical protein [Clostridia bacterium]